MYKYLFSIFLITLFSISCSDDESAADRFAGVYEGTLAEFECDFDQTEISNVPATATLTNIDDEELSIVIDASNGENFNFTAVVTSNLTLLTSPFLRDTVEFRGDIFRDGNNDPLRMLLIGDCNIFGTGSATFIFNEN